MKGASIYIADAVGAFDNMSQPAFRYWWTRIPLMGQGYGAMGSGPGINFRAD